MGIGNYLRSWKCPNCETLHWTEQEPPYTDSKKIEACGCDPRIEVPWDEIERARWRDAPVADGPCRDCFGWGMDVAVVGGRRVWSECQGCRATGRAGVVANEP